MTPPGILAEARPDGYVATFRDASAPDPNPNGPIGVKPPVFEIYTAEVPDQRDDSAEQLFTLVEPSEDFVPHTLGTMAVRRDGHLSLVVNNEGGERADVTSGNPAFGDRHRMGVVFDLLAHEAGVQADKLVLNPATDTNISPENLARLGMQLGESGQFEYELPHAA